MNQMKVSIVIPIYQNTLADFELKSLKQCVNLLGDFEICIIKPISLELEGPLSNPKFRVESFENFYFKGISGYNKLLHALEFYQRFANSEYMLIYQLDAFVFKNDLQYWCDQEFDYIGAPWISTPNTLFNRFLRLFDSKKKKERAQIFYKVGNGGLSLRKVSTFIDVCEKFPEKINENLGRNTSDFRLMEDVFWSIEVPKFYPNFRIPNYKEALNFAFDRKPQIALKLNKGKMPFGCHGFNKPKVIDFWKTYI